MFLKFKYKYYKHLIIPLDKEGVTKLVVDAELYAKGLDYNSVLKIDRFYEKYCFESEKDFQKWKKVSLKILNKIYPIHISEETFSWITLMYGLKMK